MKNRFKLRSAALLLAGPAVAATGLGFVAAAPASAAESPAVTCTSAKPIEVNGFAFNPAQVTAGGSSVATLITTNCLNRSIATSEEWTGKWLPLSSSGGAPAGCPVIDPFVRNVSYLPGQRLTVGTRYTVPAGCHATQLAVTVHISTSTGVNVASATAYLRIVQPA